MWRLAAQQHDVVDHEQLLALGYSRHAIHWRIEMGRLHPIHRGVYAVGRPTITRYGELYAAVLACGGEAAISHDSAAELWGMRKRRPGAIHVSVPRAATPRISKLRVHRRRHFETTRRHRIPVTTPICTVVDLATTLPRDDLEAAINEADKRDLVDPERLRKALDALPRRPGLKALRQTLDIRTFSMTDSRLERLFLPIARRAGLPKPLTQQWVNGFRVDFWWPDLELVVETDGLRYHRTPAQQTNDARRRQIHAAAGLTPLQFTRAQVRYDPAYVEGILRDVAHRLGQSRQGGPAPLRTRPPRD